MNRVLALAAFILVCPGCIAWEIRDEMRTVNRQLGEIDPVLVHTTKRLATVNADIGETNRRLGEVQASLTATQTQLTEVHAALVRTDEHLVAVGGTLGETNPQLTNLDGGLKRMQILNDVQTSLKNVDTALGPLSKTMGSLTSTMSFFGLGDSEADLLAADASPDTPAAAPDAASAPPAPTQDAAAPAPGKPDYLVGTWLNAFPDGSHILCVLADGRFFRAEKSAGPAGQPSSTTAATGLASGPDAVITRAGRWAREGRTLRFRYEPAPGQPAGSPQTEELTAEIVSLSGRTLTVRIDGNLRVYTRP